MSSNDYFRSAALRSNAYLEALNSDAYNAIQRAALEEDLFGLIGGFGDDGAKRFRCPEEGKMVHISSAHHAALAWSAAARSK